MDIIECGYECNFIVDELNQLYFTESTNVLNEDEEKKFTFTKIEKFNDDIKLIRITYDVIFIVTENNLLYIRGRNDGGQLGLGHNNAVYNSFVKNSSLQHVKIKDLKCADYHSIILDDNGIVYSCGHYLNSNAVKNNNNDCNNNFYFKPLDFLQSKIKFITVTAKQSILYSHNNELIIIDHYETTFKNSILNVPSRIVFKSIYSSNYSTDYSAFVTKENKVYMHKSNNSLLLDNNNNKFGDFYKVDDSVLLNSLNLPYLYVIGNDHGSTVVVY